MKRNRYIGFLAIFYLCFTFLLPAQKADQKNVETEKKSCRKCRYFDHESLESLKALEDLEITLEGLRGGLEGLAALEDFDISIDLEGIEETLECFKKLEILEEFSWEFEGLKSLACLEALKSLEALEILEEFDFDFDFNFDFDWDCIKQKKK